MRVGVQKKVTLPLPFFQDLSAELALTCRSSATYASTSIFSLLMLPQQLASVSVMEKRRSSKILPTDYRSPVDGGQTEEPDAYDKRHRLPLFLCLS